MIRRMKVADAHAVADIHIEALKIGFLSTLGKDFLKVLYEGIAASDSGVGFVYEEDLRVVGFITGSGNLSKMMDEVYRKNRYKMLKIIFFKALRKPGIIKNLLQSRKYPELVKDDVDAELLSIALTEGFRGKGAGRHLVSALVDHFREIGVRKFKVGADQRLERADEFYKTLGFQLGREIEIYGKKMDIYYYEIPVKP